jgi:type II secretory pathway component PulF
VSISARQSPSPAPPGRSGVASVAGLFARRPVPPREIIYFTTQLALMLEVGTAITDAIRSLARQTANPAFRAILAQVQDDIEQGREFSTALARHPRVFDGVYVSMVRAGESGGFLHQALTRIAGMQERRMVLLTQIKTALTYPAVLCVMASLVVIFILVAVLPKFTAFFTGKEHILPFSTRFLMAASHSLRTAWWAYLAGLAGIVVGLKLFKASPAGGWIADRLLLRLPLIGPLACKIQTCQLLGTLGHLMESQVPLLEALGMTRAVLRNRFFKALLDQISQHVQKGGRLARAFSDSPYVPESVKQMVTTGEESGNLYPVMLRLSQFYDAEVDRELKTLGALIEPVALVVLGTIIAVIVSSVILPLFRLAHAMQ